ncbi:MAG: hypothetical protein ACKVZ0_00100 [Gemmatimonadales bacterium]
MNAPGRHVQTCLDRAAEIVDNDAVALLELDRFGGPVRRQPVRRLAGSWGRQ